MVLGNHPFSVSSTMNTLEMTEQSHLFCEYRPGTWREARELMYSLSSWVFRGQSNASWKLETTLERASRDNGVDIRKIPDVESLVLKQFQRRVSQYLPNAPNEENLLEWYSLIQHHGGPTRLLDLTHSFYVACFFAVEKNVNESAVFCLNRPLIELEGRRIEQEVRSSDLRDFGSIEYCNDAIRAQTGNPLVIISEPFSMNERLAAQQGLFAIPFEGRQAFEYNLSLTTDPFRKVLPNPITLKATQDILGRLNEECTVLKVVLEPGIYSDVKRDLRLMNVNAATLFPGLDGFSRSLYSNFEDERWKL